LPFPPAMTRPTEIIQAVQHIRKMRGGSQPHLLRASDNQFYVIKFKNNPQHIRILANEYLGSRLGAALGLPMPAVTAIDVSEWLINNSPELKIETGMTLVPCASGLQFGSRYAADPQQAQVFDYMPEAMFRKVANREDFPRVLAFDKWTGNSDGRQAVFVKRPKRRFYHAVFIDQGYCFNAGEWDFSDLPLRGAFARNAVYETVIGWESFEPVLSRIEQIDLADLRDIAREIPKEWYQNDTEGMSRLVEALYRRRSSVRDLITSFRTSTRNPFPSWMATVSRPFASTPNKTTRRKLTEMTDGTLKCVILLDPETRTYKPTAHNVSANLAVEQFSADPGAKIINQAERHRSAEARKCKACKKAAEEATSKHVEASPEGEQSEQEPAAVSEEENESD
jgi:hypothetical protein